MFILTRRIGETIMIGDDVAVTILGAQGNQVRVRVNAPKSVEVHCEEIYNRILAERNGSTFVESKGAGGPNDQSIKGRVSFINSSKGYGFIDAPELEKCVYFQTASVVSNDFSRLHEGNDVQFQFKEGRKGPVATCVKAL